jgi:hypothetical protein
MKFWIKTGALVLAVWLAAALVIYIAKTRQPTAASVTAFINSTDLDTLQGDARARAIARMEDMMNRISFDDRQHLDRDGIGRRFLHELTPAEQDAYLDATLPTGFRQLMDSFNKMDPVKRKEVISEAVNRLKEHEGDGPPPGSDPTLLQHVVDQGLKSFYSDADADVKLDMAPLIEQIQRNLEHP